MTEQAPSFDPDDQMSSDEPSDDQSSPLTGIAAVDQVLMDVDALHDLPLDQHVAAFEGAHESLRGALDAQPGDSA